MPGRCGGKGVCLFIFLKIIARLMCTSTGLTKRKRGYGKVTIARAQTLRVWKHGIQTKGFSL